MNAVVESSRSSIMELDAEPSQIEFVLQAEKILSDREFRETTKKVTIFSAFEVGKIADIMVDLVQSDLSLKTLDELFVFYPQDFLPVEKHGELLGYVKKEKFRAMLGQTQYSRDILLRSDNQIDEICDLNLVVIDARTTLPEAARLLMKRPKSQLYDPFVITYHGRYYGISTVKAVMDGIAFYEQKDVTAVKEAQQAMNSPKKLNGGIFVDYDFVLEQLGEVGGDFIYAQRLQSHLSIFSLMDVSGKGLKAAQMAMAMGAYYRALFKYLCKSSSGSDFKTIRLQSRLKILNTMLVRSTPSDMYASGVFLLIDIKNYVLQYFDFGASPVFLLRGGVVRELPKREHCEEDGFPFFGIDEKLNIKGVNIRIKSGDLLFAFSDGLSEARNVFKEEFGEERIQKILARSDLNPSECVLQMKSALHSFRGEYRKLDDLSMLAIAIP